MTKKSNILVVGSSNTDMVVEVAHLPAPGETVLGGTFAQVAGGKGANQAVAAQRLGGSVAFIASVGQDDLGTHAINDYKKEGIDTQAIQCDPNEKSGVALIFVNKKAENSIAVASGANATLSCEYITKHESLIQACDIVLLQLESPLPVVEHTIKLAAKHKKTIILDPAPAQPLSDALLSQVTFITPNETEASMLSGITVTDTDSAKAAATILLKKGVSHVLITLGEKGTYSYSANHDKLIPSCNVQAVDTTAAGDTFNGAFAAALTRQENIEDAIHFAQAAAALSVTKKGAQPSIPTKDDTIKFISELSK